MAPENETPDVADRLRGIPERWARPPEHLIGKLPRAGTSLDYFGHADLTLALLQEDPTYNYGWNTDDKGDMLIRRVGKQHVLEGWLEVHGVRRHGVGTCADNAFDPEKQLIGDLLRNVAMRFGFATELWSKQDRHDVANPQYVDPAPAPLSPAQAEIADLFARTKTLTDAEKAVLRDWTEGRSVKADDLADDDEWRAQVIAWVDEIVEARTDANAESSISDDTSADAADDEWVQQALGTDDPK